MSCSQCKLLYAFLQLYILTYLHRAVNTGPASLNNSVSCADCYITGIATASTAGFTKNQTLLADVVQATEELAKNPDEFLAAALGMDIVVDLENLSGHFEFDIKFEDSIKGHNDTNFVSVNLSLVSYCDTTITRKVHIPHHREG